VLADKIEYFKKQFMMVTEVLNMDMKCKCRETVCNNLIAKMPNTTAFDELPEFTVNNSAPTGGKALGGAARLVR